MASEKPLRIGNMILSARIYSNRLEIRYGWWPFRSNTVFLYKNIATVGISRFAKRLEITTNDGRLTRCPIYGNQARRVQSAILERM